MAVVDWLENVAPGRRWFADKSRQISSVDVLWQTTIPSHDEITFLVARYNFVEGESRLYSAALSDNVGREAVDRDEFKQWLLASFTGRASPADDLRWTRLDDTDLAPLLGAESRALGVEQSNTSIRYGDRALIKLNRRLSEGPSPEAELAAVITKAADPSFAARTHGVLWLDGVADWPVCLAICSAFVPNVGDGWGYLLSKLADSEPEASVDTEIQAIADVTAAMHRGLISDPWHSEVAPEPITAADIANWREASIESFENLVKALGDGLVLLPERSRELARLLPGSAEEVRRGLSGFQALSGTYKIRIHGDFHLGQLLRKPSGGYVAVDFDGEPNRSLAERRAKYSALRDVAGMARSLAYVRGTAQASDSSEGAQTKWLAWESGARSRYLERYRAALDTPPIPLVPTSTDDFRLALAALELEKAIYECGYELSNRPDWLWLPLSRLVRAA